MKRRILTLLYKQWSKIGCMVYKLTLESNASCSEISRCPLLTDFEKTSLALSGVYFSLNLMQQSITLYSINLYSKCH